MQRKISSLAELENEKRKLKTSIEFTKEALEESFAKNQQQVKRFAIENIALPASVLSLGKLMAKQFNKTKTNKSQIDKKERKRFDFKPLLKKLFPIAINMLQAYLLEKHQQRIQKRPTQETSEKAISPKLKSVS